MKVSNAVNPPTPPDANGVLEVFFPRGETERADEYTQQAKQQGWALADCRSDHALVGGKLVSGLWYTFSRRGHGPLPAWTSPG